MKGVVGRIYGEASSTEFTFFIFNPREVKRTDYVKVWNDIEGWVVAQVVDVRATSESVTEGRNVEKEVYIGKAVVIGKRDENGVLRAPKTPFVPGENVFKAEEELIIDVLGLEREGVYIGLLEDHDIRVRLDTNSLVQKHCCILAKTGSGKSYTAGVIMEELMEKDVPLLIIDPHGEYATMKEPNRNKDELEKMELFGIKPKGYGDKIRVYVPPNSPFTDRADGVLKLDGRNLSAEEIFELTGLNNSSAQALLYQAIKNLKGTEYTIEDIISEVEGIKHNAKWTLLGALEKIVESGLFDSDATPLDILLRKGRAVVLDMRGVPPEHQQLIVSRICGRLFEMRKRNEVPAGMIVIEEAHNFIPERGFGKAISTPVLRTIASEGRKFGLGLMVISQRPARVDKNVISQCNTQIIMRVTNPNDINAVKKGVEGLTSEMVDEIKRLPPGTAMVVSPELEKPIIVRVRVRKSMHSQAVGVVEKSSRLKADKRRKKIGTEKEEKKEGRSIFRKMFGG